MENSVHPDANSHRLMEIAVPLFSFGGALLAILFFQLGISLDFHYPATGFVIASCILAYLSWIRPKKDIVALTTPIYSLIFFFIPTDYETAIILQLLYATSLTILLVRLKYRFGKPGTAATLGKELGGSLKIYIGQTHDSLTSTSPDTAHQATLAFVQFAQGDYGKVARMSVTDSMPGEDTMRDHCLSRAFSIVKEHAELLDKSLPRPETYWTFMPGDAGLLAKQLTPELDKEHEFYLALDNALLLLFSVAWTASERDRPHLLACQTFAQKLMSV